MSVKDHQELACPKCSKRQDVELWRVIDAEIDPELRSQLLKGEVNMFHCSQCGFRTFTNYPLLYNDQQHEICIHFYPPEALQDAGFYNHFTADGEFTPAASEPQAQGAELNYLRRPHIVFHMPEMLRYIQFREKLMELWQPQGS